ncbi:MAG TPA: hypothetical protein DCE42_26455 [Myxococcales bacterium]|nr:hypothetical protein [Deltaproteobacteria bacterium]HAA58332.1 hypothetical protein [Myxococcales bacterium]
MYLRWFFCVALCLTAMLGVERDASALTNAQFRTELQKVIRAYQAGNPGRALRLSRRLVRPGFRRISAPLRVRYFLYAGMAMFRQKSKAISWKMFEKALRMKPALVLPKGQPTELVAFVQKVRESLKRRKGCPPFIQCEGGTSKGPKLLPLLTMITGALAIVGLGTAGISAVSSMLAGNRFDDVYISARSGQKLSQPIVYPILAELQQQAAEQSNTTNILWVVGGVLGVAAATLGTLTILSHGPSVLLTRTKPSVHRLPVKVHTPQPSLLVDVSL